MAISLTIRRSDGTGTPTTASIAGDGEIDTRAEARAALAAVPAGQDASSMTYVVGSASYSYAQITGAVCLGRMPHRTVYASRDNWVLSHPGQCMATTPPPSPGVVERTAGEALNADAAAVRTMAGLSADANILGVQFDSLPEDTTPPYEVPAASMTTGDHTLKVRYRGPSDTTDQIKTITLRLGAAPVVPSDTATRDDSRTAYGVWPTLVSSVVRTDGASGAAHPDLNIGNIEVTSSVPQGSMLEVRVGGNVVSTIPLQPTAPGTDHVTQITIPQMIGTPPVRITEAQHQIGLRINRPGQPQVRYNDRAITVGPAAPASATLSTASVTSTSSYYLNDSVRIRVTSDRATRARITVGNHTQDVDLVAGVNNITLTGAPKTWDTGGAAGTRQVFSVQIQPSGGSAVTAGQVSIQRQGGGGGRGRGTGGVTL